MGNTLRANQLTPEVTPLLELSSSDQRQKSRHPLTKIFSRRVICVIFVHFCIHSTMFFIMNSLVPFTKNKEHLDLTPTGASILKNVFIGTFCIIPALGGWLADAKLGRFWVILYGTFICFIGTIFLLLGSIKNSPVEKSATTLLQAVYITGLILFGFGGSGTDASIILFAAEQVSYKDSVTIRLFYSWFCWLTNFTALLALTFVVFIQQQFSYFYGNLVLVGFFGLAWIVFLAGQPMYSIYPSYGSVLSTIVKVVKEAIKRSNRPLIADFLLDHWLDRARMCLGGSFSNWEVEDVKKVYRLMPILAILIMYWTIREQMQTSIIYQANNMDKPGFISFADAPGYVAYVSATLILLLFMEKLFYPLLAKFDICPSQLRRMGIGMIFATASMVCAGGIEWYRVEQCCREARHGEKNFTIGSNISVFYQVPQSVMILLSDILTMFTAFEFIYTETPRCIQGFVMGINHCIIAWRFFFGQFLVCFVNEVTGAIAGPDKKWFPDEHHINNGHYLAYYFFLLAGLMFLVFILYIFVALSFKAKKESAEQASAEIMRWAQYTEISSNNEDSSTTSYDRYARHSTC